MMTYLKNPSSHNLVLWLLVILSACKINGEFDDCYDDCYFGEKVMSYRSTYMRVLENSSELPDNHKDSICKCDFELILDFLHRERIVSEKGGGGCCGYNEIPIEEIEAIDLFAIDTESEDTTNVEQYFKLNYPSEGQTMDELDDFSDFWFYLNAEIIPDNEIPLSTVFYVEVSLTSGKTLTDHTQVLLFEED